MEFECITYRRDVPKNRKGLIQAYHSASQSKLIVTFRTLAQAKLLKEMILAENIPCFEVKASTIKSTSEILNRFFTMSGILLVNSNIIAHGCDLSKCATMLVWENPGPIQVQNQLIARINRKGQLYPVQIFDAIES